MDQSCHHATGPGTGVHRAVNHDFGVDAGHFVDDVFKLEVVTQCAFFRQQALDRRVVEHTLGVAQRAHHQAGVKFAGGNDGVFDLLVNRRLYRGHESRAHVHALCAQRQRCHQAAPVGHAARGDKRNLQLFGRARQQDEVGHVVFAGVAAALKAVHAHRIAANGFGLERMAHRRAFVNHLDAGLMQRRQPFLRVVAGRLHHLHATVDDGLDVARIVWRGKHWQKGEVHAEWLVSHVAGAADLIGQQLWSALRQPGDDAQAPRVGDRCRQLGKAHKMHAALDDGVLNAKEFGDSGFHGPCVRAVLKSG